MPSLKNHILARLKEMSAESCPEAAAIENDIKEMDKPGRMAPYRWCVRHFNADVFKKSSLRKAIRAIVALREGLSCLPEEIKVFAILPNGSHVEISENMWIAYYEEFQNKN